MAEEVEEMDNKKDKIVQQVEEAKAGLRSAVAKAEEKRQVWSETLAKQDPMKAELEQLDVDHSGMVTIKFWI